MTPRAFSLETVQARLELMNSVLRDLEAVGDVTPERMRADPIVRGAVERFLSQIVDLAVSINTHIAATVLGEPPRDYRSSFAAAAEAGALDEALARALQPSAGLRNVLVHEYFDIDIEQVARAAPMARRDYRRYVQQVARFALSFTSGQERAPDAEPTSEPDAPSAR